MYKNKRVLLIAGGGTLGTYTAKELLRLGCFVDVICLEDKTSDNDKLHFIKEKATLDFLSGFLEKNHYDGIINFIHYPNPQDYEPIHRLLCANVKHLIFLSSYRVYADEQHPITEDAPMLLDVTQDKEFLKREDYALSKARAERFIKNEKAFKNWTIVRPVISFSQYRFDVVTRSGHDVISCAKSGTALELPAGARHLTAGLDWAGNTGKLIANLLFKEHTMGQAYTVSSAPNLTWEEVADIYSDILNLKIKWIDDQSYAKKYHKADNMWILIYDRFFDRRIDNSKILAATGLGNKDFSSVKDGVKAELKLIAM